MNKSGKSKVLLGALALAVALSPLTLTDLAPFNGSKAAPAGSVLPLFGSLPAASADSYDKREAQIRKRKEALNAKKKQNADAIANLNSSVEGVDKDLAALMMELKKTELEIPTATAELQQAEAQYATARREEAQVKNRLDAATNRLGQLRQEQAKFQRQVNKSRNALGKLARSTYRGANNFNWLDLVLNSKSSSEFLTAYSNTEAVVRIQSQQLAKLEETAATYRNFESRQAVANKAVDELDKQAKVLVDKTAATKADAKKKADKLLALQAAQKAQQAKLAADKARFEAQLARKKQEDAQASAQIQQLNQEAAQIAREREAHRHQTSTDTSGVSRPSGLGRGMIIPPVPVPLVVTSPFGMRWYPFGGYWMHTGVDLRSRCGETQVAAASGQVSSVRPAAGNSTHGNQIFINHGRLPDGSTYVTVYNHLSRFLVRAGQWVEQGQPIGLTGQTGLVTGCHSHFEVWRNGKAINPMSLPGF